MTKRWTDIFLWFGTGLSITSLVAVSSRLGDRLGFLHDIGFFVLAILSFALMVVSWEMFGETWKRVDVRHRQRLISICGCAALSCAFFSPFVGLFLIPGTSWGYWTFGMSLFASLCGVFVSMPLRFSLFFGGLTVIGTVMVIPIGVL